MYVVRVLLIYVILFLILVSIHQTCYMYLFQLDFWHWLYSVVSFEIYFSVFAFCSSLCIFLCVRNA